MRSSEPTCLNLKKLFGEYYRIELDQAAYSELGGTADPWYFQIPCKYGHVYPYSARLLAYYCEGGRIRARLHRDHPEIEVAQWSDIEEAVFLFSPEQFEIIAEYARPKRKPGPRKLSEIHRKKLLESGEDYRFVPKSAVDNGPLAAHESSISRKVYEKGR